MQDTDHSSTLATHVEDAFNAKRPLQILAGGSKNFYGNASQGEKISIAEHRGVINYQPNELLITARAGTPISELQQLLSQHQQRLLFEPPNFDQQASLGGTVAADFNGPIRPWSGGVKDALLGVRMINGRGQILSFGGEVMKNVAGYDISRLLSGSLGTLGILLDISMKVLPLEKDTISLKFSCDEDEAIAHCGAIGNQYLPITAISYLDQQLSIRLSGNAASVAAAQKKIGGEAFDGDEFWTSLREFSHDFFQQTGTLWRLSVPPNTPAITDLCDSMLIDWGGAQRWFFSDRPAQKIRQLALELKGHATVFRQADTEQPVDAFQPLAEANRQLHQRIKQAFDPHAIFNPQRLYRDL